MEIVEFVLVIYLILRKYNYFHKCTENWHVVP